MTQEALGSCLQVTGTMVSHWENAKKHPSAEQLNAIANVFGITIDEMIRPLSGQERARLLLQLDLPALRAGLDEAKTAIDSARSALAAVERVLDDQAME